MNKRLIFALPLIVLVAIAGTAIWALTADRNLQAPPSQLIGREAPEVQSVFLDGAEIGDIVAGEVRLVNFFASYCIPCIHEHNQLTAIAGMDGVAVSAVTFNDQPDAALGFLRRLGNPFRSVHHDADSADAIAWGVNAIPTTFVVNTAGKVVYRHDGAINAPELAEVMAVVEGAR